MPISFFFFNGLYTFCKTSLSLFFFFEFISVDIGKFLSYYGPKHKEERNTVAACNIGHFQAVVSN